MRAPAQGRRAVGPVHTPARGVLTKCSASGGCSAGWCSADCERGAHQSRRSRQGQAGAGRRSTGVRWVAPVHVRPVSRHAALHHRVLHVPQTTRRRSPPLGVIGRPCSGVLAHVRCGAALWRTGPCRTFGRAQASTTACRCQMAEPGRGECGRSDVSVLKRTLAAKAGAIVEHVCWLMNTRERQPPCRAHVSLAHGGGLTVCS